MASVSVPAWPRDAAGKGNSRRLRRAGKIPAVVYGGLAGARSLAMSPGDVRDIVRSERGVNTIFTLAIEGESAAEQVMIHDFQLHPLDHSVLHADLMRVDPDRASEWTVPVHLKGESPGVKRGGHLDFITRAIRVTARPHDIPAELAVDVSSLDFGDTVRAGEIPMPEGSVLASDPGVVVLHVKAPRVADQETEEETEEAAEEEGS